MKNAFKIIMSIILAININIVFSHNKDDVASKVSYAEAVSKAAPAVVSIQTTQEMEIENHPMFKEPLFKFFFGAPDSEDEEYSNKRKQIQQGLGSGVIIDKRGYILTNNHVIKDASSIIIKFANGLTSGAKIIGTDTKTDLAVLKINESKIIDDLVIISLGDSEKLKVGDVVLAIGNPFGFDNTVTQGIVSGLGLLSKRSNEHQISLGGWLDNLIQTDAAINPGNSGGALIDVYGKLVGINIAIITKSGGSQGIGFAIPINLAKNIMEDLINKGHVVRGWLGVQLSELGEDFKNLLGYDKLYGIYVQSVIKNGPASNAGIMGGDIIVKINDIPMNSANDTVKFVSSLEPEKECIIEIFRSFRYIKYTIKIGQVPKGY